jgi:hypothetical protein
MNLYLLSVHCICILNHIFLFQIAKEAADRWVSNLMLIVSYCKNKFSIDERTLDEHFGINQYMDSFD